MTNNAATNVTEKVVNKSASAQKLNVSLKSTDDSTPPVTVPLATVPECNFIINSELFFFFNHNDWVIVLLVSHRNLSTVIEHLISEKMGLAQFFNI